MPADSDDLQQLLDTSFEQASEHLRSIMTPPRRLSAERLLGELPCPAVLNIATVTAHGEPRITAVDGHFLRGHWYFTTAADSPKARHLRARPAISASYTPRDGFGIFCHGRVCVLGSGDPERQMVTEHFRDVYGQSPEEWASDILYARIDPHWMVAFAMTADEQAEIDRQAAERRARAAGD